MTSWADVDSRFIDYPYFEDTAARRREENRAFMTNAVYVPLYQYPKLDRIHNACNDGDSPFTERKIRTRRAIMELEAANASGSLPEYLYELYASYHEMRLKRMLLVEAAAEQLRMPRLSPERRIVEERYKRLNKELYGVMNAEWFNELMSTESDSIETFRPRGERAQRIQSELLDYTRQHRFDQPRDHMMHLSHDDIAEIRDALHARFHASLAEVPDAPEEVVYNAAQCAAILQRCLDVEGLGADGWTCVVDAKKLNPATSAERRCIMLPVATQRTASELKRLWLHEGGVHAIRGEHGRATGITPLAKGTADYAAVEEGAGVLFECVESGDVEGSPAYGRARDRYILAGLALGTDGVPKDGRQCYEIMWRMIALRQATRGSINDDMVSRAKHQALLHDENAFRGTNFAMPGVIYSKLKVYYEGLMQNIQYMKQSIQGGTVEQAIESMLLAKYNHTNPDERMWVESLTHKDSIVIKSSNYKTT